MNNTKIISILENELNCINRANYCDRECINCDLVLDDTELIEAYIDAIRIIQNNTKYRKSAKRFKRKYIFLKIALRRAINEINNMIDSDCYETYQFNLRNGLVYAYNIIKKYIKDKDIIK